MTELAGRTALIAGASQGLGKAIAAAYLRVGASVAICARDAAMLEATRTELAPLGRVIARPCDVSNRGEVDALVGWAAAELSGLDVLVNSAGVYGPMGPTDEVAWDAWREAIEIDLFGAVLLCRAIVPHFKRRGGGKIIQLSGGGATAPMPRITAYATAKAAVVRFCESLALELAPHHVDVNTVAPGALNTRMLDEVLAAGPDKVGAEFYARSLKQRDTGGAGLERGAELAVFLASRASDGVTGRLLSALWDPWRELPAHKAELDDIYTLRRITARERGKDWEKS